MAPLPKNDNPLASGVSDREKRARAHAARRALGESTSTNLADFLGPTQSELYKLISVPEQCSQQELQAAYKKRALEEHPDKGGDQERFDELQHAYSVLSDAARRDDYDEALARVRDAVLVEGKPEPKAPKSADEKAPKTAPRVGSKRSKDWLRCGAEHDAEHSGAALVMSIRLAILDADGGASVAGGSASKPGPVVMAQKDQKEIEREQTEALFLKYKGLNDGMKKQWSSTLTGKQKQALKARAKQDEAEQMEKAKKWLTKK
mmetsp:Transcript_50526/g.163594  ORF Transcript_50526/g.163594 Transcript_50526/m.163594 type:complete len:262 (-) Transcript_50526:205-990(-)